MMPIAANRETRKPTPDTPPTLSGRWLVDPQASHARFVAGTLAGLVKTPGRFRALSGNLVVEEAHAGADGVELVESYPRAFTPKSGTRWRKRLRDEINYRAQVGYTRYFLPGPRRYDMPNPWPWALHPLLQAPAILLSGHHYGWFSTTLGAEDVRLAENLARSHGVLLPLADAVKRRPKDGRTPTSARSWSC